MAGALPSFDLRVPERIRFGRGTATDAAPLIRAFGTRVLLVHGRSGARTEWLGAALHGAGAETRTLPTLGEPDLPQLDAGLTAARAFAPDVVVGCGGGSALDLAKAIAALAPASGAPLDYLEVIGQGRPLDALPLPFVAIPTTAGTGAEATKNAVIGSAAHARKVSLRDDRMLARLAIVDPALTDGSPRDVTLACGLDALTQVIEPFLSARANAMTDALCRAAIPMGCRALAQLAGGEDPAARDAMAYVSLSGGIALANAGLGAVHGLAGPIGGLTGAPHGAICGALLPHALAVNRAAMAQRGQDSARIDAVDAMVRGATGADLAALVDRAHDLGLPRLSQMGVTPEMVAPLCAASVASSSMKANPVALSVEELEELMHRAMAV